ncbi:MAG: winged helix-turn-helix transcriptional regulator [Fusobacterium sp.]|nr:winged helix-turn-helix transcriptional regulator [Fusobacterium sp.]
MKNLNSCDCDVIDKEIIDKIQPQMLDEKTFKNLAAFFKVIGNDTRVKILWLLDKNDMCVCDIAVLLDMTKSAVSHQLSSLKKANFVKCVKEGRQVIYSLADNHVREIVEQSLNHISHEHN